MIEGSEPNIKIGVEGAQSYPIDTGLDPANWPPSVKDAMNRLLRQGTFLINESERGVVLVAAAMLDSELGLLIQNFLVPCSTSEYFVGLKGPLADFGARIDAAYCLGLITLTQKKALDLVKDLRNLAAHRWDLADFATIVAALEAHKGKREQHTSALESLRELQAQIQLPVRRAFEAKVMALALDLMVNDPLRGAQQQRVLKDG